MMIPLGAVGELKEMTCRHANQYTKEDSSAHVRAALYKFLGVQDGFHVRHYVFQLVGGTYKTCVSETDFMCGYYHFTGSPETMRKRHRTKKAIEPADLYCNLIASPFIGKRADAL